ncbi:hypothetical protein GQ457_09G024380 [Hibiscus cannabinus]
MFHCNGWCFLWTLAALCGTNICIRHVNAKGVYSAIAKYSVTHFCAAPVVLNSIVNASPEDTILPLPHVVCVMTVGAAPPPSVLAAMSQKGFRVTHTYGLSETYGPSIVGLEGLDVISTQTGQPVPADGKTIGEIVFRGNLVMKGYLKNPKANEETFANGWFHSGYLGVKHPDRYIEVKDRSKDIIISGGENISSVEVENGLYMHPAVLEASVVARADERWGESPCAFVTLKPGVDKSDERRLAGDIMKFCRSKMPAYWVPKSVIFGPLPKTATGNFITDIRNDERFWDVKNLNELSIKLVETGKHETHSRVYLLLKLVLLLPVATSTVERAFSAMTTVKNKLRNSMEDQLLNDCLVTFIEKDLFVNVSTDAIVRRYQNMRSRREQL